LRLAAGLLTTLPVSATAQYEQSRDAILTALAMNECAVTEDETAELFGAQGFDGEFVRHELGAMIVDGTAFLEGGRVLRVVTQYCPPADPVETPAQALRRAVVERDCSIDDGDARALGMDPDRMRPVVLSWIEDGAARVEKGTLTLEECE
jgi:hypothetical protein